MCKDALEPNTCLAAAQVAIIAAATRTVGLCQHSVDRHLRMSILSLAVVLLAVLPASTAGQAVPEQKSAVVSFLAPQKATALPLQTLGAAVPKGRAQNATSPTERGVASWGAYISTSADSDGPVVGPTKVGTSVPNRPCMCHDRASRSL